MFAKNMRLQEKTRQRTAANELVLISKYHHNKKNCSRKRRNTSVTDHRSDSENPARAWPACYACCHGNVTHHRNMGKHRGRPEQWSEATGNTKQKHFSRQGKKHQHGQNWRAKHK